LGRQRKPKKRKQDAKTVQKRLTEYPTQAEEQEEITGHDEEAVKRRTARLRRFLSSAKKEKPIRTVELKPLAAPEKKKPERSKCPYCSGNLIREKGIAVCEECRKTPGYMKPATKWGEKRRSVRQKERGGQRT
jgi:uncharacterized protein with PIN domain